MFVHIENGRPAFLISHDQDVTFSDSSDLARPHHTWPGSRFFAEHREATAEEISEAGMTSRQLAAVRSEMKNGAPRRRAAAPKPPKAAATQTR